jgi:hypothetical protein
MQIVMAVFAILVVLSMLASSIYVFAPTTSPTTSATQPAPTVIVVTPAR